LTSCYLLYINSLLLIFTKVIIMNKILFNFLIVGASLASLQSAYAVKVKGQPLEERNPNTQVKRIPCSPIKKKIYSSGEYSAPEKKIQNSKGKFILVGHNPWKEDPTGIEIRTPYRLAKLNPTAAFNTLINYVHQECARAQRTEQFLNGLVLKAFENYRRQTEARVNQMDNIPEILITFHE
jgi:hypothetical protein